MDLRYLWHLYRIGKCFQSLSVPPYPPRTSDNPNTSRAEKMDASEEQKDLRIKPLHAALFLFHKVKMLSCLRGPGREDHQVALQGTDWKWIEIQNGLLCPITSIMVMIMVMAMVTKMMTVMMITMMADQPEWLASCNENGNFLQMIWIREICR